MARHTALVHGAVGMYGTSYSGFNSLQLAIERPPALKAICAIYATDDCFTDDVHYGGGALHGPSTSSTTSSTWLR